MTVLIGVVAEDIGVFMAADRGMSTDTFIEKSKTPKLLDFIGDSGSAMIIGVAGSHRVQNVLRELGAPADEDVSDVEHFVYKALIKEIRSLLRRNGLVKTENGVEEMEAALLLAIGGRLFLIQSDFSIYEALDDKFCIGQGGPYALGYFYDFNKADLEEGLVLGALHAAAYYAPAVSAPFDIWCLGEDGGINKDVERE